ncbi:MAG: 50S ribosomal protein L21 [Bryobacter sp.]|jgi:large subunit ribosomal protein L21|nr:50S ribosomal protein L21 [Bryobacter sp. CoA8 C33]
MYAVIEAGGKQYRVAPGDLVRVDTLHAEPGTEVELGKVLMVAGESGIQTGADAAGVKVTGTVTKHGRGEKVIVFKFKRKKQYKRTQGHRQNFTEVKINAIA